MMSGVLLGMQAAGMVVDYLGTQDQIRMSKIGSKLEQASISSNLQMTRLQAENATVQSMQNLRSALGSQIAMQAARGTAINAGSALTLFNQNFSNFNSDAQARRINLLAKENEFRAQSLMSSLHQTATKMGLQQEFFQRSINRIPGSSLFGGQGGSKTSIAKNGANGGSYGMTPV